MYVYMNAYVCMFFKILPWICFSPLLIPILIKEWNKNIDMFTYNWTRVMLFFLSATTHGLQDLSSPTRDWNWARYHNGEITHLGPDILECEVKWALGSITMNKARGGTGIAVQLSQILKMMLWKWYTQYTSKFGKFSSGHRTGIGWFSFQSQRKEMPKNAQSTAQLHSSHTLVK